jgi:hypothetical protein
MGAALMIGWLRPKPLLQRITLCMIMLLMGCDSVISKHLVIRANDDAEIDFQARVVVAFDKFAQQHGFSCERQSASSLRACRAIGPRFLSLESKGMFSFFVLLDQPFPGGMHNAPETYTSTAKELEALFRESFSNRITVEVTK